MKKTSILFLALFSFSIFFTEAERPAAAEPRIDELVTIANAVAGGNATGSQKAIAILNNDKINLLRLQGKISNEVFQKNQDEFAKKIYEFSARAAKNSGCEIGIPKVSENFKAVTDTDIALLPGKNSDGRVSAEQSKQVRDLTNRYIDEFAIESGVEGYRNRNHCGDLEIDAFASPENMSGTDFARQSNHINDEGGFAYSDPDATKVQIELDRKNNGASTRKLSNAEAMAYQQEMMKNARMKEDKAMKLQQELRTVDDPEKKLLMEGEIRKYRAQSAKYRDRSTQVTERIAAENGQISSSRPETSSLQTDRYSQNSDRITSDAQLRNSSDRARRAEAVSGALDEALRNKAVHNFNRVITNTVDAGANADEAARIISKGLKDMSPGQQGQSIDDLRLKNPKLAEKVNTELIKLNSLKPSLGQKPGVPVSGGGKAGLVSLGLGLVNMGLNVANSSAQGDTTTKILWDMSVVGPVVSETSDYTATEIERLKNKYRQAGENVDSVFTRLKILAEASAKGTGKGTFLGLREAFYNLTFTGTVISAGNMVTGVLGEGLDTVNVLDTTYAEMQNQSMEQDIQNAMGARFGREAVAELKRLASVATGIRSILRANVNDSRQICREYDRLLKEFRVFLKQYGEAPAIADAEGLTENEKRLAESLRDSGNSIAALNSRALAALAALTAGGDPMAAARAAAELTDSADQEAGILVRTKIELDKLSNAVVSGDSEIPAAYAAYRARLQELADRSAADAAVIRKNEVLFLQVIEKFTTLKEKVTNAERYFAGRRQTNEASWMVISSDLKRIDSPDRSMPEGFAAEIGTLERLPEKFRADLVAIKAPAGVAGPGQTDQSSLAQAAFSRLLPPYNADEQALQNLRETIRKLLAEADKLKASAPEKVEKQKLPCGHFPGDPECGTSRCRIICQDAGWVIEWPGISDTTSSQSSDAKQGSGINLKSNSVSVNGPHNMEENCSDLDIEFVPGGN